MIRRLSLALTAAAVLAAALSAARAQFPSPLPRPFSFGVSGGLAVPAGQLGDNVNAGYSVSGLVDLHPAPGPLSLRLEVGYDRFETKQELLSGVAEVVGADVSANAHFLRGTGNVVLRLANLGGLRPYVTGGVGAYRLGSGATYNDGGTSFTTSEPAQTRFGVNGGVGVELPLSGITVLFEARAHGVQTDATPVTYVPITVGFRF